MEIITINIILAAFLALAVAADIKSRKIPNALTLTTIAAAVLINTAAHGSLGTWFALKGCAAGVFFLLIPFAAGGIGGGDVKMLAAVGALKGASFVFAAFLLTAVAGGIFAVAAILMNRGKKASLGEYKNAVLSLVSGLKLTPPAEESAKQRRAIPYAAAIATGTIAALVLAPQIL